MLSQGLYLLAATGFATVYLSLDLIMIRAYSSAYEVGLYALVPQVMLASQMIPYAVVLARFPDLAKLEAKSGAREDFHRALTRILIILFALSSLAMISLSVFIMSAFDLVFGPDYAATKPLLWIATLALPPLFLRQLTIRCYMLTGEGWRLACIELIGLAAVSAALVSYVPHYGGIAAILAVTSGVWLTLILSLIFLDQRHWWRGVWRKF
jgi:O-antigen/teichoic acid export membrane protein